MARSVLVLHEPELPPPRYHKKVRSIERVTVANAGNIAGGVGREVVPALAFGEPELPPPRGGHAVRPHRVSVVERAGLVAAAQPMRTWGSAPAGRLLLDEELIELPPPRLSQARARAGGKRVRAGEPIVHLQELLQGVGGQPTSFSYDSHRRTT